MRALNVGIVGATGVVGELFLRLLHERAFPVGELRLFASARSAGETRNFWGRAIPIVEPARERFRGLDLVFFSSGDDVSRTWAPVAVSEGAFAVDNSAAFRTSDAHPLVVPEINAAAMPPLDQPTVIANPNCSTIQLVLALAPLARDFGLKSVRVATYQAVSGAGKAGQDELRAQLGAWLSNENAPAPSTFPAFIANNCLPQIGGFDEDGFCTEEIKIRRETRKILGLPRLAVSAFTVRIPAWNVHSEAAWIELGREVSREDVLRSLSTQEGLAVDQSPGYPTALSVDGRDDVRVGRVARDPDDPRVWRAWIVGDNLRKGAALNGIQIAETLFGRR